MKDEALKLALEALDTLSRYADTCELFLKETHPGKAAALRERVRNSIEAITAIKQALAAPVQENAMIYKTFEQWMNGNFLEVKEPRKKAYSKDELLLVEMGWNYGYDAGRAVEQALDKKAENARELGLGYEPVWCGHCNGSGRMVRDPDIGTDQECFVCDGAGVPAAPVQEPVAWAVFCGGCQKEWSVPYQHPGKSICAECEAKLKEKNT